MGFADRNRSVLRRLIPRNLLGSVLAGTGILKHRLGDRCVVLAFHRVDDRYPDDHITTSSKTFSDICSLVGKYFDVVPLRDIVDGLVGGQSLRGKMAITFDDGYRDNLVTAAPILHRHALPATFFITTGFINSGETAWWDREQGIESEWLSWEEVRDLQKMGFDVGCHTLTHPNLGVIDPQTARAEVRRSKEELENRLGISVDLFAYPFGRPDGLSEANLEEVRSAGFICAPACCGGLVAPGQSPFRMNRVPINNWYSGGGQLLFELARME